MDTKIEVHCIFETEFPNKHKVMDLSLANEKQKCQTKQQNACNVFFYTCAFAFSEVNLMA